MALNATYAEMKAIQGRPICFTTTWQLFNAIAQLVSGLDRDPFHCCRLDASDLRFMFPAASRL